MDNQIITRLVVDAMRNKARAEEQAAAYRWVGKYLEDLAMGRLDKARTFNVLMTRATNANTADILHIYEQAAAAVRDL